MKRPIDAAAFDLDGTLYPNYGLNLKLWPFILREWRLLAAFGRARSTIRRLQRQGDSSLPPATEFYAFQAGLTAGYLGKPEEAAQTLVKIETLMYRGWEPLFRDIKIFPHVRETLAAFREQGLKLGLLSDFPPEVKLEYLGLSGLWDVVRCSEQEGRLKPDPLPFTRLAAALGLPPERILYVGNSYSYDAAGAAAAGMQAALVCSRFSARRAAAKAGDSVFVFYDYRQLLEYVLS
jgi:putative hydrolase of the HAD superfamily